MTASTLLPAIPSNATLYQRAVTNEIGATVAAANSIGYLAANKSQLEVVGQLTPQDKSDSYSFVAQTSGDVRLNSIGIDGTAPVRIQIYDGTGTGVIADSQGTTAQKAAYQQFVSSTGYDLKAGKYAIQVSYGTGGNKNAVQNYALQIGSGTTFTSDYRTLANATTIANTQLSGGSLGYNALSNTAAALTSQANGDTVNVFGALSLFSTTIFA